jgi:hypothetical protein
MTQTETDRECVRREKETETERESGKKSKKLINGKKREF